MTSSCFLGKLSYSEDGKGSRIKATEFLPKGWLFHIEVPVMISTIPVGVRRRSQELMPIVGYCPNCSSIGDQRYMCNDCAIIYCSEKCCKQDLHIHKKECEAGMIAKPLALPIRMLAKGVFPSIIAPEAELPQDELQIVETVIRDTICPLFPHFTYETIRRVILQVYNALLCVRTFICRHPVAYAYYQYAGYYNHSCDPNAYFYFVNNKFMARTIRDIQPQEEITICYNENTIFTTIDIRSEQTFKMFNKPCLCERCNDADRTQKETRVFTQRGRDISNATERKGLQAMRESTLNQPNVRDILDFECIFNKMYGPLHSLKFQMYYHYTIQFFQNGNYFKEITQFPKYLENYMILLNHIGLVRSTVPFIIWSRFVRFLLLSITYNADTKESPKPKPKKGNKKANSNKGKSSALENNAEKLSDIKSSTSQELELVQAAIDAKHVMEDWMDWKVLDMDVQIYGMIGQHIAVVRKLALHATGLQSSKMP